MVLLSEILGSKNPRSGQPAEDTEIIHHQQLVHDSHSGHLLRTDLSHHDIVQQAHKVCDPVLNHDRYCHRQNHSVKCLVPNKFSL